MVNLLFESFVDKIRSGEIKQAIRTVGKREYRKDQALKCYKGPRYAKGKRELLYSGIIIEARKVTWGTIRKDHSIATTDGFSSYEEFSKWFREHFPDLNDSTQFWVVKWK